MEEEKEELSTSHGPLHNSRASYHSLNCSSMYSGPLENSLASRLSGVLPSLSRASLGLSDISGSEGLEDQVLLCSFAHHNLGFHCFCSPDQEMPHTSRPSLLCTSSGLLDPDDLTSSSHSLLFGHHGSQCAEDETDGPGEVTSGPLENTSAGALDLTSASLEPGDLTPTPLHPGDQGGELLGTSNEASARLTLPPSSTRTSACSSATSLATAESYTSCASRVESSEDEVLLFICVCN